MWCFLGLKQSIVLELVKAGDWLWVWFEVMLTITCLFSCTSQIQRCDRRLWQFVNCTEILINNLTASEFCWKTIEIENCAAENDLVADSHQPSSASTCIDFSRTIIWRKDPCCFFILCGVMTLRFLHKGVIKIIALPCFQFVCQLLAPYF